MEKQGGIEDPDLPEETSDFFMSALGRILTNLARKLIHISTGLVVMLCWPMFSSSRLGAILAGLVPSIFFGTQLIGVKDYKKLMKDLDDRYGDGWELANATIGYVIPILLVTVIYWRSPMAIATISNLCAGDGVADIVGRRFGSWKLPYNKKKSLAGSIGMTIAGFNRVEMKYYDLLLNYGLIDQ